MREMEDSRGCACRFPSSISARPARYLLSHLLPKPIQVARLVFLQYAASLQAAATIALMQPSRTSVHIHAYMTLAIVHGKEIVEATLAIPFNRHCWPITSSHSALIAPAEAFCSRTPIVLRN